MISSAASLLHRSVWLWLVLPLVLTWMIGISWSDHWSFSKEGYPAIMLTDTAPFRYPHYHRPTDTPDKLDLARMARVVAGVARVTVDLAGSVQEK